MKGNILHGFYDFTEEERAAVVKEMKAENASCPEIIFRTGYIEKDCQCKWCTTYLEINLRGHMGIYYYAIDHEARQYFESPMDCSIKDPGIFVPGNPFAGMVVMRNAFGSHFVIENDEAHEIPDDYEDVGDQVFLDYLESIKGWDPEFYAEMKENWESYQKEHK